MKITGIIDRYVAQRGFGWIHSRDSKDLLSVLWFHISFVKKGTPVDGATVEFIPAKSPKGAIATEVEVIASSGVTASSALAGDPLAKKDETKAGV
jgi:cold shock CspA family protein